MLINALLFTLVFVLWAVVHSLLAAFGVRRRLQRRFGPAVDRWYRLGYNLFSLVSFLPVLALYLLLPDALLYEVRSPWRWGFLLLQAAGAVLFVAALLQTDLLHFAGLAQLRGAAAEAANDGLRQDGLYGWVRHPLYTTGMMVIWFTPRMSQNWLIVCVLFTLYFYLGSIHEEQRLLAEFGEAYAAYRRRVPRLLPRLVRRPS